MQRNSAVEIGTRMPKVSTGNIIVGRSDAANKYVPIVVVVLAIGCANPVTKNMLRTSLRAIRRRIEFNLAIFLFCGASA